MLYREVSPPPPLTRFVECLWVLEAPAGSPPGESERILPDGSMELVLHYRDRFERLDGDPGPGRTVEIQPRAFLIGEFRGPVVVRPSGASGVLGVRFRPGGTGPFFEAPGRVLADRTVTLEDLWGPGGRDLLDQVREQRTLGGRLQAVIRALQRRFDPSRGLRSRFRIEAALETIERSRGRCRAADLARAACTSSRQLERTFRETVGVTPKLLCRIRRFQAVLDAVQRMSSGGSGPDWTSLALDCGYYDQPHLIRDFRAFSGVSPRRYLAEAHTIEDCILSGASRDASSR